ncbi:alpha/beta fold hydrolase [Mycobacterium bourgelatii]|nr:alpha/beta hydrolase [Mycobacterium bourgelatii]MCV6976889.1 alpha/beta hydrolase [Mycobacterium bourgelatii]
MALAVRRFTSGRVSHQLLLPPPTRLTDDELRRISAPTTVLLGAREVIYAGGPQAALARAHRVIRDVHARRLPNVGHVMTLDAPDVVADELTAPDVTFPLGQDSVPLPPVLIDADEAAVCTHYFSTTNSPDPSAGLSPRTSPNYGHTVMTIGHHGAFWGSPEKVDTVSLLPWWHAACVHSR